VIVDTLGDLRMSYPKPVSNLDKIVIE
jgi:hypothetical protein